MHITRVLTVHVSFLMSLTFHHLQDEILLQQTHSTTQVSPNQKEQNRALAHICTWRNYTHTSTTQQIYPHEIPKPRQWAIKKIPRCRLPPVKHLAILYPLFPSGEGTARTTDMSRSPHQRTPQCKSRLFRDLPATTSKRIAPFRLRG
jgi:hypothetical protein